MNVLKLINELQATTQDNYIRMVRMLDEQGNEYEPAIIEIEDNVVYVKIMELG